MTEKRSVVQMTGEQIRWLLIAVTAAGALLGTLLCCVKHKKKRAALVVLLGALTVLFFAASDIRSSSEYGGSVLPDFSAGDMTVVLSVDASEASEGVFPEETELLLYENESVLELLTRVCEAKGIRMDASATYVKGIGGLYEFDCGSESGWVYTVNGVRPGVSAADYVPNDGDVIVWRYVISQTGVFS